VNLSESLDVMDDSYADVWAKLTAIEALGGGQGVDEANVHIPMTLTWVDGVVEGTEGRTAIHTHRVYFHHSEVARSEIDEGKRRVSHFLEDAVRQFESGGPAERELGAFDRVILAFDTRGYGELKSFLRFKQRELEETHPGRFEIRFVDEMAKVPKGDEATRRELGRLVRKYRGQEAGVGRIIEGVIYSRYVGLLLELKTIEHYTDLGWTILQSGRDMMDERGHYVTELDAVVRGTDGRIRVVEAKSARVQLPLDEALRSKIEYKLATYKKNRALMEKNVGGPFDVVFSVDVGYNDDFARYCEAEKPRLEAEYGFKLEFLFLDSRPEDSTRPSSRAGR
jgi:hypothetical protein